MGHLLIGFPPAAQTEGGRRPPLFFLSLARIPKNSPQAVRAQIRAVTAISENVIMEEIKTYHLFRSFDRNQVSKTKKLVQR
jgi:hypothetical protein